MRFKGLDLNLLVALQALIETENVSLAAERLNLSQAAMSNALARLRETLDDDLLMRVGRRMVPTERARALQADLSDILGRIETGVLKARSQGHGRHPRRLNIMAAEAIATEFLPRARAHLARAAPEVSLIVTPITDAPSHQLETGKVDLLAIPRQFASPDHPSLTIYEEAYVVVVSATGRWAGGIGRRAYLSAEHVVVMIGAERKTPVDRAIIEQAHGQLRAPVTVYSQAHVPWHVLGSDLVGTLPERLARQFAGCLPLALHPLPFDIPANQIVLQWNRTMNSDLGLRWIVEQLAAAGTIDPVNIEPSEQSIS